MRRLIREKTRSKEARKNPDSIGESQLDRMPGSALAALTHTTSTTKLCIDDLLHLNVEI
jgi:hypothetical protein